MKPAGYCQWLFDSADRDPKEMNNIIINIIIIGAIYINIIITHNKEEGGMHWKQSWDMKGTELKSSVTDKTSWPSVSHGHHHHHPLDSIFSRHRSVYSARVNGIGSITFPNIFKTIFTICCMYPLCYFCKIYGLGKPRPHVRWDKGVGLESFTDLQIHICCLFLWLYEFWETM